jgi:hypothetical protein
VVGLRRLGRHVEPELKGALLAFFGQEPQLPFQRPRNLVLGLLGVAAGAAMRFGRLGSHGDPLSSQCHRCRHATARVAATIKKNSADAIWNVCWASDSNLSRKFSLASTYALVRMESRPVGLALSSIRMRVPGSLEIISEIARRRPETDKV